MAASRWTAVSGPCIKIAVSGWQHEEEKVKRKQWDKYFIFPDAISITKDPLLQFPSCYLQSIVPTIFLLYFVDWSVCFGCVCYVGHCFILLHSSEILCLCSMFIELVFSILDSYNFLTLLFYSSV